MQATPSHETVIPAAPSVNSNVTPASGAEENRRSRKPANTKFKQQQLPAWQPMLTARSVLPFLVAIGLAFIPIGIALYLTASNVVEISVDYTNCQQYSSYEEKFLDQTCANVSWNIPLAGCKCQEKFSVPEAIAGPVFIYYGLDNFFQNHRKYVKSRDDNQLMGDFSAKKPAEDCSPFAMYNGTWGYAPCGAIANSLFNDSIKLIYNGAGDEQPPKHIKVDLLRTGIAWRSDREVKFRNPQGDLKQVLMEKNLRKPKNWQKELWELDRENPDNNGLANEDFIVWMRTAAFPTFRKLYRRVNHTDAFQDGLPAGNYSLDIDYNYPVTEFEGRKYVVLSSVSWLGGRNTFLGIAYMVVGSICIVLAAVFFFIHIRWGKNVDNEVCYSLSRDSMSYKLSRVVYVAGEEDALGLERTHGANLTVTPAVEAAKNARDQDKIRTGNRTQETEKENLPVVQTSPDGRTDKEDVEKLTDGMIGRLIDVVTANVEEVEETAIRSIMKGKNNIEETPKSEIRLRSIIDQPVVID